MERMRALVLAERQPDIPLSELLAEKPDVVLCLGDLDGRSLRALRNFGGPKLGVYGDRCRAAYFDTLQIADLHGQVWDVGGISFSGLEGAPRYKTVGDHLHGEEEAAATLAELPRTDVFIAHAPPFGINDEPATLARRGYRALRAHLEAKPPAMLLHSHTEPAVPVVSVGGIEVRCVSGHAWVELPAATA